MIGRGGGGEHRSLVWNTTMGSLAGAEAIEEYRPGTGPVTACRLLDSVE